MSAASPLRAALESRALESPDAPFLFFRGERGHFGWWSFAAALAALDRTEDPGSEGAAVPRSFLAALDASRSGESEEIERVLGAPSQGRDVWISTRSPEVTCEAHLALWAIRTGAAIVREPGDRLHPELFAWARPTLVSGQLEELARLFDGFEALAPRLMSGRWRRRRLARLRRVLVEGAGAEEMSRRLVGLGAGPGLGVLPFPGTRW